MKILVRVWMILVVVVLASCGGGEGVNPADPGVALAQSSPLQADPASCAAGESRSSLVDGKCLQRFEGLALPVSADASAVQEEAQLPQATAEENSFFSWAERTYASYFPGAGTSGASGIFSYRYYASSGNYLAVASGGVYVLGPMSAGAIMYVGPLSTFSCLISPTTCNGSGGSSGGGSTGGTNVNLPVPGTFRVLEAVGNRNPTTYLVAGSTYVFDLEGVPTGEGTLADPVLRLNNPQGIEVAMNDDSGGSLNSRIVYTATVTGIYRFVVSGYQGANGTYLLTGAYGSGSGGSTGGGSTGGGSTGGGSTGGTSGFITWTGSVNGTIIKDADNENYQVRASDRLVFDPSNSGLTGLTVDSSAQVLRSGQVIGYVGSAPATTGNVAVFFCSNGSRLNIATTSTSWDHSCGGSTGGGSTGGGSTGGGSTGGGNTGGGNTNGGTGSRGFYTWTGSANGEVVLDSTDESFRFYSDNGCIYSNNTRTEYTNFCLSGGATVYFSGSSYSVTKVRSTTGSCIAGLLTSDGYFADIYTSAGRIQYITRGSRRPASC
jgi:hypothetical protein